MPRLPNPGSDADNWGTLLNDFLRVDHHENGKLRNTRNVLNVRDFGAKGDGITSDRQAIQSALAAVPADGGVVYFPAGTYLVDETLTILTDRTTLQGEYGAAMIKAQDNTSFEIVISAPGRSFLKLRDLVIDANGQRAVGTPRTVALSLNCDDSECSSVIVKNTIGTEGHTGVGLGINGNRNRIIHCEAIDCGLDAQHQSDGFYVSGTQNLLMGCVAKNCTDTGFVIETASHSGMIGCTAVHCAAGAAITNASIADAVGNFMVGVTIDGWSATVTGGIAIGITGDTARPTGNLVDTMLSGIVLTNPGSGPAIRVTSYASAITKGLLLSNLMIDGAGTQGVLLLANTTDVSVTGGSIKSDFTPIQISSGCKNITIQGVRLYVGGGEHTFGVAIQDPGSSTPCESVLVQNCIIRAANPTQQYAWGIYVFGQHLPLKRNIRIDGNLIDDKHSTGKIGAEDMDNYFHLPQVDSSASELSTLKADFNSLLGHLREVGVLRAP